MKSEELVSLQVFLSSYFFQKLPGLPVHEMTGMEGCVLKLKEIRSDKEHYLQLVA